MGSSLWFLFIISFLIFFRSDVVKIMEKFKDYPYLLIGLSLTFFNYILFINSDKIRVFFTIVFNLINRFHLFLDRLFQFFPIPDLDDYIPLLLKALILALLLYYPYRYRKLYSSRVYYSEIISINIIFMILIIFFCFFCVKFKI